MGWNKAVLVSGSPANGDDKWYKEGSFDSSEVENIDKTGLADGSVMVTSNNGHVHLFNEKQDDFVFQFSLQEES